jgi:hypothetical protein
MKLTLLAAAFAATTLLAAPAFADCAEDMAKITEAAKTAKLDEANTAKAKDLMDKAMAAQAAKDEATCTTNSKELMTIYGM